MYSSCVEYMICIQNETAKTLELFISDPAVHGYVSSYGNSDVGYGGSYNHDRYAMHQVHMLFNLFYNLYPSNAM